MKVNMRKIGLYENDDLEREAKLSPPVLPAHISVHAAAINHAARNALWRGSELAGQRRRSLNDRHKFARSQARAANQRAIDIVERQYFCGIIPIH